LPSIVAAVARSVDRVAVDLGGSRVLALMFAPVGHEVRLEEGSG
jgi:hypothetical protein